MGDDDAGETAAESPEASPAASTEDPISVVVGAVATELAAALDDDPNDTGLGSATDRRGVPKAKAGGEGRDGWNGKDPPHEDEADDV